MKSKIGKNMSQMHPSAIHNISQQRLTITLRPQLFPYLEGKAAYVIIIKPWQVISGAFCHM